MTNLSESTGGNNANTVLATVNFCTLPNEKLMQLLDFLGETEITQNSKCIEKHIDGECIEKRWNWYSELIVTPKKITAIGHISVDILTAEKYAKMQQLFL